MIEYITGNIEDLTPTTVTLEACGVGYGMFISLNTYSAIQGKKSAKLYVYEAIREDAHLLYGFAEKEERSMFLQLISVPGIGAQMARAVLSSFTPNELVRIIREENSRLLKGVRGIGPKVAQRIIVDLKDKIHTDFPTTFSSESGKASPSDAATYSGIADEAVAALSMLGFVPATAQKVVIDIMRDQSDLTVEQVIKIALKSL